MTEDWEDELVKPTHPIWKILTGLVLILGSLWGISQ